MLLKIGTPHDAAPPPDADVGSSAEELPAKLPAPAPAQPRASICIDDCALEEPTARVPRGVVCPLCSLLGEDPLSFGESSSSPKPLPLLLPPAPPLLNVNRLSASLLEVPLFAVAPAYCLSISSHTNILCVASSLPSPSIRSMSLPLWRSPSCMTLLERLVSFAQPKLWLIPFYLGRHFIRLPRNELSALARHDAVG